MSTQGNVLRRDRAAEFSWTLPAVLASAMALMLPALWNGYPLFYYDSVDYVTMPYVWRMPVYRTAAYGLFALTGRLSHSVWGIVAVQCLVLAYVLHLAMRLFAPKMGPGGLVAASLFLTLATGLAWGASTVMPDAFTGAVVLAILLLAFENGALARGHCWALTAILAVGTAVHTTHFAILAGLMLCFVAFAWLARRGWPFLRARLHFLAIGFAGALVFATGSNWVMTGRVFLTQPSAVLTLGLLVQDGLAKRYLDDSCSIHSANVLRLCSLRDRLPANANEFLWHDHDFDHLGGWKGSRMRREASQVVEGSLVRYPGSYAWDSVELTMQQLGMVESGDGVTPMAYLIGPSIQRYYPREYSAFMRSRQQKGIDFTTLNQIQTPLLTGCMVLLCGIMLEAWWRRDRLNLTLSASLMLALLGNAFVCGALSNPNDRYGSRIAWLALLILMITVPRIIDRSPWRTWLGSPERPSAAD